MVGCKTVKFVSGAYKLKFQDYYYVVGIGELLFIRIVYL